MFRLCFGKLYFMKSEGLSYTVCVHPCMKTERETMDLLIFIANLIRFYVAPKPKRVWHLWSKQLEQATEQPDALNTLAIITVMHTELYRNKLNK